MINLELVRTFVTASRAPTFAAAAAERRVTPAAVSQQIKALETQLGIDLFERVGRRARLTTVGAALATSLRAALDRVDESIEVAQHDHATVKGPIAIGAPRPFAESWLRPRLAALLRANPALRPRVVFGVPSELERRVVGGDLDLAILARRPDSDSLEHRVLVTETLRAYASPGYVKKRGALRSAAATAHDFIVFDHDRALLARWWRAAFGRRARLPSSIVCEVASLHEMRALAAAGIGIAILPDYFAADHRRLVAIAGPPSRRPATNAICLTWRRRALASGRFVATRAALLVDDGPSSASD